MHCKLKKNLKTSWKKIPENNNPYYGCSCPRSLCRQAISWLDRKYVSLSFIRSKLCPFGCLKMTEIWIFMFPQINSMTRVNQLWNVVPGCPHSLKNDTIKLTYKFSIAASTLRIVLVPIKIFGLFLSSSFNRVHSSVTYCPLPYLAGHHTHICSPAYKTATHAPPGTSQYHCLVICGRARGGEVSSVKLVFFGVDRTWIQDFW